MMKRAKAVRLVAFLFVVISADAFSASASIAQDASMLNPGAAIAFEKLSATREHPLFTPSRKAPQAPKQAVAAAAAAEPPPAPPQVSVSGVIVDERGPRAMLRADAGGKVIQARLGDTVAGWIVTGIEHQRITLSLDDRSTIVTLFQPKDQPPQVMHMAHTAQGDRVFEVNSAGVLRSHRVPHAH